MPTPTQLIAGMAGATLSANDLNTNWVNVESANGDRGNFVVTGLVPSAGAGLSVSVTAGTAAINMHVAVSGSFSIAGLADNTLNHLYLKSDGTATSNTTGTAPANSVKLGTATTVAGAVTAVGTNWTAGRQQIRRTEDLVHGSGAGHPRAVNLNSWHATNNEGNETKGVLPMGALPFTAQAQTTDLRTGLINNGLIQSSPSGATPLGLNGGDLSANLANLSSGVRGNGGALSLGTTTVTFPSDADYTLLAAEMVTGFLIIAAGVITAPRNLIVPNTGGGIYIVQNLNAQTVTVKTAAGTGVAMATNDIMIARVGTNVVSMKPTV